ncbi:sensor histidine kinase [Paenibacillus faecalis]|uniref:sensor histidine kinase n=1 Tax=Paenibacillus faecalis TaxID=2079532 RepID=UPI000D0EFA3A|nr:sensor histidine kinase [Paenibacillus faecalis]
MKSAKFQIFPRQLGLSPYFWLLYLSLPLYQLITHETGWKLYLGYAMISLFVITYRQLFFAEGKRSFFYWLLLQMLIIFIFCMGYGGTYLFMGFFTANFIGWYSEKRNFITVYILFVLVESVPIIYHIDQISMQDLIYLLPFIIIMLLSPFAIRSMISRQKLEEQLEDANEQIRSLVKSEERTRIARDLHDTLGHTLSLITLKSQLVEKLVDVDAEQARLEAREIQNTSRAALRQVRELVSDMRTATLTDELNEARVILQSANIELSYEGHPKFKNITDTAHHIMSLCLREAITNIVKHSQASKCHVRFEQSESEWVLSVKDDGIGVSTMTTTRSTRDTNGLKGMTERLALIGGTMDITAEEGALLTIRVPIIITNQKECEAG